MIALTNTAVIKYRFSLAKYITLFGFLTSIIALSTIALIIKTLKVDFLHIYND